MIFIFLVVFAFCVLLFPIVRCAVFNVHFLAYYGVLDAKAYFREKQWGIAPYGQIRTYVAGGGTSFGCGKTLSAVKYLEALYNEYDGKRVYDKRRNKFVTQKIHIISNIDFKNIPYERLKGLQQFVQETNDDLIKKDDEENTLTVTYLYIDEASSQLNSRNYKNNFNGLFISRLLTSRHVHASIIMTSQRPDMIDKLMREVTNLYIGCSKIWRFELQTYYDAYEVEHALSIKECRPIKRSCYFIRDKHFAAYDTYASVSELIKDVKEGNVLTEQEILELQGNRELDQRPKDENTKKKRTFIRRR